MTLDAAIAEFPNDADLLGSGGDLLLFEPGTVGWDGADPHFDTEDGVTLVRVTLVRGRHPSTPLQPDVAQGHQVLCRIGGGLFRIPKKGTSVMIGFPRCAARSSARPVSMTASRPPTPRSPPTAPSSTSP